MPHDIRISTRDHHHHHQHQHHYQQQQQPQQLHKLSTTANGRAHKGLLLLHADSPRTPRQDAWHSCWRQRLASHRNILLWLLCLLLASAFAIRHGTRLLDAAGQQHHLLQQQQHHRRAAAADALPSSSSSSTLDGGSSLPRNASAAAILASQRSQWPAGYVAICAVVKDQWPDLRYWVEYHR